MNIIEQSVKVLNQSDFSLKSALKQVEYAGRICYNSINNITKNSYTEFNNKLLVRQHMSPFAHGFVAFDIAFSSFFSPFEFFNKYTKETRSTSFYDFFDSFPTWSIIINGNIIICNLRLLYEWKVQELGDLIDVFKDNIIDTLPNNDIVRSFICTTNIAMTRELNRHAVSLAICERSTRYVENNTIVKPYWWDKISQEKKDKFLNNITSSYSFYEEVIKNKELTKQEVRDILPLCAKTVVMYTGIKNCVNLVLQKRGESGVHPQMIELVAKIKKEYYG